MKHWSVDSKQFKKHSPAQYRIWRLEQMINFGLGEKKLNKTELKRHWSELTLDPKKKQFLASLLWPNQQF